ncbi:MAG: membrane protein YdbS with pleckstrin-like domain [Myxococcota bacterium]|jgi:membrane protein YdbS with pleckstrin-like domain
MMEPDRQLDPRVVTLWRMSRAVRIAIFGLPFAAAVYLGLAATVSSELGAAAAIALLSFNFGMLIAWPALEYRYFRYAVREHDLLVQAGVIFRRWSAVPHSRIQHVDTRQGPLERALGLARLQIFTAAGVSADGSIPGLDAEEAERLRDELSQKGGADDGV